MSTSASKVATPAQEYLRREEERERDQETVMDALLGLGRDIETSRGHYKGLADQSDRHGTLCAMRSTLRRALRRVDRLIRQMEEE